MTLRRGCDSERGSNHTRVIPCSVGTNVRSVQAPSTISYRAPFGPRWLRTSVTRSTGHVSANGVPASARGTDAPRRDRASVTWPRKGRLPVSVRFGAALRPEDGEDFGALSRRMQQELARLWDEDATSWYASLRRGATGETPSLGGPQAARWRRVWESSRPLPRRGRGKVWG